MTRTRAEPVRVLTCAASYTYKFRAKSSRHTAYVVCRELLLLRSLCVQASKSFGTLLPRFYGLALLPLFGVFSPSGFSGGVPSGF